MNAPPRTSPTVWPMPEQPAPTSISSMRYSAATSSGAADLRVQREPRHLRPARLVGRDHAVGAGALELLLGVLDRGAGDDRDVRAQLARGQRREDVLGVGVHAGDERAGALDPGGAQQLVLGRRPLEEAHAGRQRELAAGRVGVDDDVLRARGVQVAGDLPPHPPEAADDVVVVERVDHLLGAPLGQDLAEMAGDEELRDRHEGVEQRTYAEDDQQDLDDLRAGAGGRRDRADRRDRVERQDEAVPPVRDRSSATKPTVPATSSTQTSPTSWPRRRVNAIRSRRPRSRGLIVVNCSRRC